MGRPSVLATYGVLMAALVGCAGKGEIIAVDIPSTQRAAEAGSLTSRSLRVAVELFEDGRSDKSRLGVRSHLWGGESYFNVPGGNPSEAAAQALAQYLTKKGWRVEVLKPGASAGTDGADVTISGTLLTLSMDAKSRFGSTKLTTAAKLAIRAVNRSDGSTVRMTLNGSGSDSVFWFEPEDAQSLVNDVLAESFNRLLQSTKVEGRLLRLPEQAG